MNLDSDYRDFRVFQLTHEGDKEELDVPMEEVSSLFTSEGVFLLVRYDIRRIFIWKGPKSPVRQRFISSRVGSKIQEESAKLGMHLKIVSVDAGDEPIEFLRAFNINSYEVSEEEKPEDMYYLRNEERRKLEEEQLLKGKNTKKKEKEEYWSPILEEQKQLEKIQKAKQKAVAKGSQNLASSKSSSVSSYNKTIISNPIPRKRHTTQSYSPKPYSSSKISKEIEKEILDLILESTPPENLTRMNIIIGNSVYAPKRMISTLFGKEVEEIQWSKMENIPDGNIDIESNLLRIYCKNNEVQGIEIYQKGKESNKDKKEKGNSEKKRELKKIPSS
ncbi:MAG: hypothetical protein K9W44_09260 [Candidatus Lokiarchaeota archaeon]|nr:hypothetical protein [Candidatus Harpocratesius repetitus]